MSMWTAIVLIVGLSLAYATVEVVVKSRAKAKKNAMDGELKTRLDTMERRLAALEDIAVEKEKAAKFEQL